MLPILDLFFPKRIVIVGIFLKATALGDMLLHENSTYCYFLFKESLVFQGENVDRGDLYEKKGREKKVNTTMYVFKRSHGFF